MRDKFLGFIAENHLITSGDSVIVALSGGADSVTLLYLLTSIKELYDLKIYAAHFNHLIRGEEAQCDADFVKDLCREWDIELFYEQADVPAVAEETGESVELCGRRLRYAFFERLCNDHGAKVATAHTLSDNTETVLMNLVRGAGIAGLKGIPVIRGNIIRPLLCFERAEIERCCEEHHLRYVTDSTNLETVYTRNKIRLEALPALRELNPSLDTSIERTARLMRDADDYLNKISTEELKACKTTYGYRCEKLLSLDKAVLSYALKNILDEEEAPYEFCHIELLCEAMNSGGSVDLGRGFRAVCAQGILRITHDKEQTEDEFCIPFPGEFATLIDIEELSARQDQNDKKIHKLFLNDCIRCDIITENTVIRHRREGDTFTDPRRGVTKSLKKLFNELKIPRERRNTVLVIADGSRVLYLGEGIGPSKEAQVDPERDKKIYWIN